MDIIRKTTKNDAMCFLKTDLHTHILPGVDDGAPSLDVALDMLRLQKNRGVERVALTPHFYPHKESLESFVKRIEESYAALRSSWDSQSMPQLCLGAEVRYAPVLTQLDLQQLTIGNSNYLLLELPDSGTVPLATHVIESILFQGIVPVLAHIERCDMFRSEPDLLLKFIQMGAMAQISADALIGKADKFAVACLNSGLAHIVASDIHKPCDCVAFSLLKKYTDTIRCTEHFARAVWDHTPLPAFSIKPIKRTLLGYR